MEQIKRTKNAPIYRGIQIIVFKTYTFKKAQKN